MPISTVSQKGLDTPLTLTSPVLTTPNLGTPSALVLTNATGTPSAINLSNATALPKAALPTGSVLQVVSANRSGEQSTTSSSFVDANLSLSITPTSATSKIFVMYTGSAGNDGTGECYLTLVRNSTNLGNGTQGMMRVWFNGSSGYHFGGFSMSFLDSPATTSATTYKVQFRNQASFVYISGGNSTDTLTAFEIAA
jgi:hypothetical protein